MVIGERVKRRLDELDEMIDSERGSRKVIRGSNPREKLTCCFRVLTPLCLECPRVFVVRERERERETPKAEIIAWKDVHVEGASCSCRFNGKILTS